MKSFLGFFNKQKLVPEIHLDKIDLKALDSSLEALRSTTNSVSIAAIEAAKVLEQRLKDTESRFYSIIDTIDDFVLVKDGYGRWKTLNKFGQNLYGWYNFEYVGKTNEELLKLYPQYTDDLFRTSLTDDEAWHIKSPYRGEEIFVNDENVQYFDVVKTPVYNEDGTRKELITVGRNVSDLREKQKRVKACFNALNSASDVIVICDGAGSVTFCNDKFLHKFGYDDYHDIVGKKLNVISSGKNNKEFYETLWNTIRSNKTWSGNIINKTIKGDEVNCKVTILPVMNGLPHPIYYICTMKPVTEAAPVVVKADLSGSETLVRLTSLEKFKSLCEELDYTIIQNSDGIIAMHGMRALGAFDFKDQRGQITKIK